MIIPFPIFINRDSGGGMSKEAMDSWERAMPKTRITQEALMENVRRNNELLKRLASGSSEGVETRR